MLQLSHVIYEIGLASVTSRRAVFVSSERDETLDSKLEVAHYLTLRAGAYARQYSFGLSWHLTGLRSIQVAMRGRKLRYCILLTIKEKIQRFYHNIYRL